MPGRHQMQDLDAGAAQLAAQRLAEGDDAGFRGRVRRCARQVQVSGDARVVDDQAASAHEHARYRQPGQLHRGRQIHLDHGVDGRRILLLELSALEQAGVVDEHVDVAADAVPAGLDRLAARQVELDRLDRAGNRPVAQRVADPREDLGDRPRRKRGRDRAADAAVCAGDQTGSVAQVHPLDDYVRRRAVDHPDHLGFRPMLGESSQ